MEHVPPKRPRWARLKGALASWTMDDVLDNMAGNVMVRRGCKRDERDSKAKQPTTGNGFVVCPEVTAT